MALAPTDTWFCGHSEARDLFIQILKKDFYEYSGEDKYLVAGETRVATGEKIESTENQLYLTGSEVDYGVLWLTDYEDDYYVANPHIVSIDDSRVAILWEEREYDDYSSEAEVYFAIKNEDGTYAHEPTKLEAMFLSGNISTVYKDGKIYWTSLNATGEGYVHSLWVVEEENVLDTPVATASNIENGVKITWDKVDNSAGYYVYRKEGDESYKRIAIVEGGNTLYYIDSQVKGGKEYTYTVGDFNNNGNYATTYYDEGCEIKYIAAPKITSFKAKSSGITITWSGSDGAKAYRIFRKTNNGGWQKIGDTTTTYYTDNTAKADSVYTYTIRCMSKDGDKYTSGFVASGTSYIGMSRCDGVWLYILNGKFNKNYTGMAKNEYGWWYIKNGQFDTSYTGMAKNQYGWWYMKNGKLDTAYTGMAKNQYGWWYLKKGTIDFK